MTGKTEKEVFRKRYPVESLFCCRKAQYMRKNYYYQHVLNGSTGKGIAIDERNSHG